MTNAEAKRIISMEHDIDILEQEFYQFIKANNLPDNFHNSIVWLTAKGVLKTKND